MDGLRLRLRDPAAGEQGECCEKDGDRSRALEHLTSKFTRLLVDWRGLDR
jgi:hypothetical protein